MGEGGGKVLSFLSVPHTWACCVLFCTFFLFFLRQGTVVEPGVFPPVVPLAVWRAGNVRHRVPRALCIRTGVRSNSSYADKRLYARSTWQRAGVCFALFGRARTWFLLACVPHPSPVPSGLPRRPAPDAYATDGMPLLCVEVRACRDGMPLAI